MTDAGQVVLVSRGCAERQSEHDRASRAHAGLRLAHLLGYIFEGEYLDSEVTGAHRYFLPDETLQCEDAKALGILSERDLFGGVAPHPYVATKAITHGLVSADARAPQHWSHAISRMMEGLVLHGFTVFDRPAARLAAQRVLERGRARLKRVTGIGGAGQYLVGDFEAFEEALAVIDDEELTTHGLVVEQHLEDASTYTVGQLSVGGRQVAYYGTQRTVRNHHGHDVYGGSDLVVVRGGPRALDRCDMTGVARKAIEKAWRYDGVISKMFPDFFASRRNYDVVSGQDESGRVHVGVLEQSWRFGGASAAEIAALLAFEADVELELVHASTHEVYGDVTVPPEAVVSYHGIDPRVGMIAKYCTLEAHGHSG
jgi:hypothetical protein